MGLRFSMPIAQWINSLGVPLAGGKLYFYTTLTATPLATYSDAALTIPNENPVVADSTGVWGDIYLQASDYKVDLKTSAGVQVAGFPVDPVAGGTSSSGLTFLQAGTAATTRTVQAKLRDIVSAADFGATGDGVTDDTAALNAWQTALDALVTGTGAALGYLPVGTFLVSSALPWKASFIGAGNQASIIKASAAFSGTYLMDFNYGTTGKRMADVQFDLRALSTGGTTTTFGSSSTNHAGGSSIGTFDNIAIYSSSNTKAALLCHNAGAEAWMFTGAKFYGLQIAAPYPMSLEVSDDVMFVAPRFTITDGGPTAPIEIDATDCKLTSVYVSTATTLASDGALIAISANVDIDGIFIEGSSALAWVFQYGSGSVQMATVRRVETNLTMSSVSLNKAFYRATIPTGAVLNNGLRLEGFSIASGSLPCPILLSVFCAGGGAGLGPLNVHVSGYDAFTTFAKSAVASTANANAGTMNVFGNFGNKPIQHAFTLPAASTVFSANGASIAVPATWP